MAEKRDQILPARKSLAAPDAEQRALKEWTDLRNLWISSIAGDGNKKGAKALGFDIGTLEPLPPLPPRPPIPVRYR